MQKKFISLLLAVIIVFGASLSVSAGHTLDSGLETIEEEMPSIGLYSLYSQISKANLTISSGTAKATALLEGYNGITTKINITMYLQKKALLGLYWSEVTSWSATYNSYNANMSKTYGGLSSGTYRVKAVFTAYSGTNSETITEYSANVKY